MAEFESFKSYEGILTCSWNKACDGNSLYKHKPRVAAVICISPNMKPDTITELYRELGIHSYSFKAEEQTFKQDMIRLFPYISKAIYHYHSKKYPIVIHSNISGAVTFILSLYFYYLTNQEPTGIVTVLEEKNFDTVTPELIGHLRSPNQFVFGGRS